MLSFLADGRKKRFTTIANTTSTPASHQVDWLKKSAVLLVPKTDPTFDPPKVPAKPDPLLACIRIIIINKIDIITEIPIKTLYINTFLCINGSGGGIRTPDTWIMIPLL